MLTCSNTFEQVAIRLHSWNNICLTQRSVCLKRLKQRSFPNFLTIPHCGIYYCNALRNIMVNSISSLDKILNYDINSLYGSITENIVSLKQIPLFYLRSASQFKWGCNARQTKENMEAIVEI